MRLWSIHPRYLDAKGLVALWREALLAQNVLAGNTKGYKNHPQLTRFKETTNPQGAIATYLRHVYQEALARGYNFNKDKIPPKRFTGTLPVTDGQLAYEYQHLLNKLASRDPDLFKKLSGIEQAETHPLFRKIKGAIAPWEIT